MLLEDLELGRVVLVDGQYPFMCSLLGFVLKPNKKLQQIHYLSHPWNASTNDEIAQTDAAF